MPSPEAPVLAPTRQAELDELLPKLKMLAQRADGCPLGSRGLDVRLRWAEPWTLLHTKDFAQALVNVARRYAEESASAQAYSEATHLLTSFLRPLDESYLMGFHAIVNGLEMRLPTPRPEDEAFCSAYSQAVVQGTNEAYGKLLEAAAARVYGAAVLELTPEKREALQESYDRLEVQALLRGYIL